MQREGRVRCPRCCNGRIAHMVLRKEEGPFLQCMACNLRFLDDDTQLEEGGEITLHGLHSRLAALESLMDRLWYSPGNPGALDAMHDFHGTEPPANVCYDAEGCS